MASALQDPVTDYAAAVIAGREPACRYVVLACERHMRDLERGEFVWDLSAVQLSLKFSRMLRHYKGEWSGQRFDPAPWQEFIKGSIFGWKNPEGTRRYRHTHVELPRKNGKTFGAADVGLQLMYADREPGAEVYAIATKRDQARIVWDDANQMIRRCRALSTRSKIYQTAITYPETVSRFMPLSKDTKTMDGLNVHGALGDEFHAWEDDMLFNQMNDAMGSRRQPLFYRITTAGKNIDGICYQMREYAINILEGNADRSFNDDKFFAYIATLDDDDDWRDETTWSKANPNLGISKKLEYQREQVDLAQKIPSQEFAVLNKQFNIWTTMDAKWLDGDRWNDCAGPIDPAILQGQPCHLGIDLSTILDLTAVVALFPPGPYPEYTVLPRLYLPAARLDQREREDRVPYRTWVKQGHIITTPGDVIDMEFIKRDILDLASKYKVIDAGFDPFRAVEVATYLLGKGIDMVQMRQGHATLGAPTLAFEKLVLERKLRHAGHPVLRWMAGNTAVIRDTNDNIRPDKKASRKRIDGIVAAIMALGRALVKADTTSVYNTRGFIEDE